MNYPKMLLLQLMFIVSIASSDESPCGELQCTWQGDTYTVTYSFMTGCPEKDLLQMLLQPEHVIACMKRANLNITVVDREAWRNRIVYSYSYLISQLHLRINRTTDTTTRQIFFSMEACSTSGSPIVPSVRSSEGSYTITPRGDSCRVDYRQQTTLDRNLNEFYLFFIKRDTKRVLRNQERYSFGWRERNMVMKKPKKLEHVE